MDATADELAGVVDLFGGLTRQELAEALSEAAFRADGRTVDEEAAEAAIERALESFALVRLERGDGSGEPLLVAGPTAFPSVPEHAEDLPHILDVDRRRPDRAVLGERTSERFSSAVDDALADGDEDRIETLLDVSYDLEAWAPLDLDDERARLVARIE